MVRRIKIVHKWSQPCQNNGFEAEEGNEMNLHTVVKVNLYGFTGLMSFITNLIVKQNFVSYTPKTFKVLEINQR